MIGISTVASFVLGNEWARLAAIAVLCFGFGWVKGWGAYPRTDVAAIIRDRDNAWESKLKAQELDSEQKITAALEAAASVPTIADDAALVRMCNDSASCRDKSRSKR